MRRLIEIGIALSIAFLGVAVLNTASAQDRDRLRDGDEETRTYSGRGDYDQHWIDHDREGEADLEGRWVTRRGYGAPGAYSRGALDLRAAALPRRLVIDQRRNVVRVEDFKGRLVQQIVIGGRGREDLNRGGYVRGQWRDSKLVTIRRANRDTRIIQTFALANRGRTLVVYTRHDARGTERDVQFTNVYQRV